MSMSEMILPLVAAFAVGTLMGVFFFGGLHWTLRKYLSSPYAGLFLTMGTFLRISITLFAFYYVGHGQWQRLLACLAGFLVARTLVVHGTRGADSRAA